MDAQMETAAELFRQRCLLSDDSLFFPGKQVWTLGNLTRLRNAFVVNADASKRSFWVKYEEQLANQSPEVQILGAEVLAVYYLFPTTTRPDTKRAHVQKVAGWSGATLLDDNPVMAAFDYPVINPGSGYNLRRHEEMRFLIDFAIAWKASDDAPDRSALLSDDPWGFQEFVDGVAKSDNTQMRHILLALLYPEYFEAIASSPHKRAIADAFQGLLKDEERDLDDDQQLYAIRQRLNLYLPDTSITFYEPPLVAAWRGVSEGGVDGDIPLDVVDYKKQVIFYGPPGTGKTFQAKGLAQSIIRSAALSAWGASEYFANPTRIDDALKSHIHRQQLHPAYGYEQFVRALHIDDHGATVYRDGFLLEVIDKMKAAKVDGDTLPHVLILDEINRTDLSRMLGECFSLLEDREEEITLAGLNADGSEAKLEIPENLYIIGTMNLIDQSVEQVDFALRRRFLWIRSDFDPDALMSIFEAEWRDRAIRVPWERVQLDFQRLAAAGTDLNEHIHASPYLGADYEVGHTYLLDALDFLLYDLGSGGTRRTTFLFDRQGDPKEPMWRLWRLSLLPLLEQYLAGLDAPDRDRELDVLVDIFLARRSSTDDEG